MARDVHRLEKAEPVDVSAEFRDLISAANKTFGESNWTHTVISQTLDFVEVVGAKCYVGCASFVKVQIESGIFHQDIGYYTAGEATKGLSIHNARIGSAVNALKRALLSFGGIIERELEQLQRQAGPEQANDLQKGPAQQLDKQNSNNSNKLLNVAATSLGIGIKEEPLAAESVKVEPVAVESHTASLPCELHKKHTSKPHSNEYLFLKECVRELASQLEQMKASRGLGVSLPSGTIPKIVEALPNVTDSATKGLQLKNSATKADPSSSKEVLTISVNVVEASPKGTNSTSEEKLKSDPTVGSTVNSTSEANPLASVKYKNTIAEPCPTKTNPTSEQTSKSASSANELLRMERKRKQMEKQMEFKRRMVEKEKLMSVTENKPNPKY
ncbi:PREDICTED: DNA repair protein RAD52 homolog isoform X2 [Vollenhovia emeryi]|uniref:DNA repair protein RAD52 homolog isoform X2 n=1 Tax=Vollenhovia emeryi TaxID=411798 RepID=UPI0005F4C003|nr:PREDICTED: DNA repair protein RAD52 homolog isoform X2 [Vollenhovia emeryi]